ncbi:hypothetical protein Slin15195_G077240 [Septoria linicola]|uniref:Uncharacterized protein n=1 Tax=Septoria linicola TaxID=215465 RepID=A0A9Q9EKT9_9PEZI|nr:hypothetical protein Slin14017_G038410 [Septoria linicola]USW54405.1 hypothetical protein Slin15195_G077240 [Septoria linicola]
MKRITRKYLSYAQVLVFAFLLAFVLLLNLQPGKQEKRYAWTKVHYRTTAKELPAPRGRCPRLAGSTTPALVVARVIADGADTRWLTNLASLYHLCIYSVDAQPTPRSSFLQVPANRGHEAMPYLTFLIDNYDAIPEAGAVFVHGSRFAWHNDAPEYDNAVLLKALNMSSALEHNGYANLRCDWSASTCSPKESPPQGSLETLFTSRMQPWSRRAVSDAALPGALQMLFQNPDAENPSQTLLARSDAVRAQCCAQFAVSRANIWRHSRDEYIALRQWLLDEGAAPSDDRVAGRILSYVWHILFLASPDEHISLERLNAQTCPSAEDCYCRLYGRCNLKNCHSPGRCGGQYVVPPGFRLPEDWEQLHGAL